jgi:hypothetical protein
MPTNHQVYTGPRERSVVPYAPFSDGWSRNRSDGEDSRVLYNVGRPGRRSPDRGRHRADVLAKNDAKTWDVVALLESDRVTANSSPAMR